MMGFRYIGFFLLMLSGAATGQDLHFSQNFHTPLTINPANTGFVPDGDYRLGINYRKQWSNIMSTPYQTFSAFADARAFENKIENGWLGIGGLMLNDVAGAGSLKSTKFYGSVAYHQMLGNASLLSGGFNLGYVQKSIDVSKLKFPDQFDGHFFNIQLPTAVVFDRTRISYFDIQAGLNYTYFPTDHIYINLGYSMHHVNKAKESFFNDYDAGAIIPQRHIIHTSAMLKVSPNVIISPGIYYTNQARAQEAIAGVNLNYDLSGGGEYQFMLGAWYRNNDAFIALAGLEVNKIKFTFSYDATVSTLKNFNNSRGASEISIIKTGLYPESGNKQILCPRF